MHGSIKTTRAKAKALEPELDRLMGLVAEGSLASRRQALSMLANDRKVTDMLFEKYASLAQSRKSGFTTSALLPPRRGDSAEMMQISWVEVPVSEKEVVEKKEEKKDK